MTTITHESDRTVVYKLCKRHRRWIAGESMERACSDCRRATFYASMRARGIKVTVPTYPGVKGYATGICGTRPWGHTPCSGLCCAGERPSREPGVFEYPERIPGWRAS